MQFFLALARTGSVRAAGASLAVSHSTVARRVEALEERLATRLFDRSREGYALTPAGEQMMPGALRVEREMCAIERGVLGQDERLEGVVAITCCDSFVSDLLIGELVPFCEAHPGIELSFTVDSRPFDLSKREADVAVRVLGLGTQPPEHLIGLRLVPLHIVSYVAIEHAERLDPELPGSRPRWLSFDDRRTLEHLVSESSYPEVPWWGAFASMELIVQAACRGFGVVMLPSYVGDRVPALRRLAKPDVRHVADIWLVSHPDLRDNVRFRATRAAVAEALRGHLPLFRGELRSGDATACPAIATGAKASSFVG
ncbi:MAG: LysR family transcriptional regulator [Alphaproteobacteria bacterium]|nr:LysR family transcriptional regulator [Alphaproteobacteria bacterium]MCB9795363.1 LysR family transcriptional regulator [Alphaproteobacteria bacterium]